jgi:RHH-type transcriptional regulator, proline utilization regulon repressor / proline dehydrogenase / delta 1-pyrroline-5-carboxylate dehydrogenase
LTGATATAKLFMQLRLGIDLIAETGGKNALIITALADRDQAIKDLVQSAFGFAGQKCSACSLAILEGELYDDLHFREQLRDAVQSLAVGSAWELKSRVTPLIREANPTLLRGLTVLDEGEEWLLKPLQDAKNPNLWSPGIKLGVKRGSFAYQNELFGPVLGLMRAEDLEEAVDLANGTPYGLTSGLHSLDQREKDYWLKCIEAGNCYINRSITGAIVQRQPFGGYKQSSFGPGLKAGGPNYLIQFMSAEARQAQPTYQQWWNSYYSQDHDPSQLVGEANLLRYLPRERMLVRFQKGDSRQALLNVLEAARICGTPIEVSCDPGEQSSLAETEEQLIERLDGGRVRFLSTPSSTLKLAFANAAVTVIDSPVNTCGRVELLHYLREVSISHCTHRYGLLDSNGQIPSGSR